MLSAQTEACGASLGSQFPLFPAHCPVQKHARTLGRQRRAACGYRQLSVPPAAPNQAGLWLLSVASDNTRMSAGTAVAGGPGSDPPYFQCETVNES